MDRARQRGRGAEKEVAALNYINPELKTRLGDLLRQPSGAGRALTNRYIYRYLPVRLGRLHYRRVAGAMLVAFAKGGWLNSRLELAMMH